MSTPNLNSAERFKVTRTSEAAPTSGPVFKSSESIPLEPLPSVAEVASGDGEAEVDSDELVGGGVGVESDSEPDHIFGEEPRVAAFLREATSGEGVSETASRPLLAPDCAPSPLGSNVRRLGEAAPLVGGRGNAQTGESKASASHAAAAAASASPNASPSRTRTQCAGWFERLARCVRTGAGERVGCVFGVYLPCVQNAFGAVLFLRLGWLVGAAGLLHSLAMLVLCTSCTLLSAISMSAIASAGLAGARPALQSRNSRQQHTQSPARGGNKQQQQQLQKGATSPAAAPPSQSTQETHVNLASASGAEADTAQSESACGAFGELLCGCGGARGAKRVSGGVCGYAGVAGSSQHGAYLIVSRALGAEFGGVVGLLYYLGHTLLVACYCLAAVEILTKYLVPSMNVFDDPLMPSNEPLCSSLAAGDQSLLKCPGLSSTSGGRASSFSASASGSFHMRSSRSTASPTSAGASSSVPTLNPYLTPLANHNARLFGSCALLLVFFGVFIGRRFVARVSSVALVCLLLALLAVFIGIFVPIAHNEDSSYICKMFNVLYRSPCRGSHPKAILENFCSPEKLAPCYGCSNLTEKGVARGFSDSSTWTPSTLGHSSWNSSPPAVSPRLESTTIVTTSSMPTLYVNCSAPFQKHYGKLRINKTLANLWLNPLGAENLFSAYAELGWRAPVMRQRVDRLLTGHAAAVDECDAESDEQKALSPLGRVENYEVLADLTTSFSLLLSFMFVAMSGFMVGSHRIAELAEPYSAVPRGMLAAIGTSSSLYALLLLLLALVVDGVVLRDKFGAAFGGSALLAEISWPHKHVVHAAVLMLLLNGALNGLTSAPRLLQTLVRDLLGGFGVMALGTGSGAPLAGTVAGAGTGASHAAAGSGYARMRGAAAGGSGAAAAAGAPPAHGRSLPARSFGATVRASIAQCAITSRRGEPIRAIIFTALAAELAVLVGNWDLLVPLVAQCFLMVYLVLNVGCLLQTVLNAPNWRPQFKYYHWSTAGAGCILCFLLMLLASPILALLIVVLTIGFYKYMEFKAAEKEWGDGLAGLAMSAARYALLRLEQSRSLDVSDEVAAGASSTGPVRQTGRVTLATRNWRPQILYMSRVHELNASESENEESDEESDASRAVDAKRDSAIRPTAATKRPPPFSLRHPRTLDLLSQLKAGRGLTIVYALMGGSLSERLQAGDVSLCRRALRVAIDKARMKNHALSDVLVTRDLVEGVRTLVQTAGLGGLRPNCVMLDWPYGWNATPDGAEPSEPSAARPIVPTAGGPGVVSVGDMSGSLNALRQQHQRQYQMNHNVGVTATIVSALPTPSPTGALGGLAQPATSATSRSRSADWHMFVEAVRASAEAACACLVVKGAEPLRSQRFPRCSDQWAAGGTIDVWWIVHDGDLLMLLPMLLLQNRVWRNCRLRIFTVAELEDNSVQMKRDLKAWLAQLHIVADFEVVEMGDSEISAYTVERTVQMMDRANLLRELMQSAPDEPSVVPVQQLADRAHEAAAKQSERDARRLLAPVPEGGMLASHARAPNPEKNLYTFTGAQAAAAANRRILPRKHLRQMHSAVRLNQYIISKSSHARLVIVNMPTPTQNRVSGGSGAAAGGVAERQQEQRDWNYMNYLETLTEGLPRVLLVRGSGLEVVSPLPRL